MGIEDRDWYQEKYKNKINRVNDYDPKLFRKNNDLPLKFSKNRTFKYFLFSIFMLVIFMYGTDAFLDKMKISKAIRFEPIAKPLNLISGGIILRADRDGHFRGSVLINNVSLPFMIDTGATLTVIPTSMALAAGLPFGDSIQSNTAGGPVLQQKTHISSLKIGTAEIRELDAGINQHLNEVLIGMNTLKYFHITQNINTLTLVAFTKPEEIAEIEKGLITPLPAQIVQRTVYQPLITTPVVDQPNQTAATTTWKKTVTCEGSQCKTRYGK